MICVFPGRLSLAVFVRAHERGMSSKYKTRQLRFSKDKKMPRRMKDTTVENTTQAQLPTK